MANFFTVKASSGAEISNFYSIGSIQSIEANSSEEDHFSTITLQSGKELNVVEVTTEIYEKIIHSSPEVVAEFVEYIGPDKKPSFGWVE